MKTNLHPVRQTVAGTRDVRATIDLERTGRARTGRSGAGGKSSGVSGQIHHSTWENRRDTPTRSNGINETSY
uniref:Ribosomal protein L33 n=1 Tax=Selaginella hainanensis TaxID=2547368 RepID=A0A482CIB4_9TRAC|nr:ribosomal protein L33 [Selaginella hainanensis]QBL76114.1 ribosomal protein L33 [Selaginella hainanensis]